MTPKDFLFRGSLADLDPAVDELVRLETARQAHNIILIPSESSIPAAVREAVGSSFNNIYAEGYPLESTRKLSPDALMDFDARLPEFRRESDLRYYKGTEYANVAESLARRRAAELFAANGVGPDGLFVNVQPLSGAPANNAVYTALLDVGDTVMGMDLIMGGHLSHGSPVNRSGLYYNIVSYGISPETEQLDYDAIRALALASRPKMIIAGFSSYPIAVDWQAFRRIAEEVNAYLLADIAHFSGLVAAGVYPNPVGIADVVSFTTHKTLNGPRGAVILTHRKDLAPRIDRAVFPGEQGGPHVNSIVGLAVALQLAQTDQFRELQATVVENARRLAARLAERGLRIPYGGTDSHMFSVDCSTIIGTDGTPLSGEMASRVLDLAGIVVNRQTIPGDTSPLRPSGIRIGTPWVTQRGLHGEGIDALGDLIADVLYACHPYALTGRIRAEARASVRFQSLMEARVAVREMALGLGIDTEVSPVGYPHVIYPDDAGIPASGGAAFTIGGGQAAGFLQVALTSDVDALAEGDTQPTHLLYPDGSLLASGFVQRTGRDRYQLTVDRDAPLVAAWLHSLSDGLVLIDESDHAAQAPGPVTVAYAGAADVPPVDAGAGYATKAMHIGQTGQAFTRRGQDKPTFAWVEEEPAATLQTPVHPIHLALGGRMAPFAGYDMPLWYTSVSEEHNAVRQRAGIFDVAHMGVWDAQGPGAAHFLDQLTTNDVARLKIGQSHYTYFLDTNGIPHDDLMIYRLEEERYLIVVNASNDAKDWAWVNAVQSGAVRIDEAFPWRQPEGADRVTLRDLRAADSGEERRVDIAIQGPGSRDMLLGLGGDEAHLERIRRLPWAGVTYAQLGGFDLIVSRTGYTGERIAYELFVHPDRAAALFEALVRAGTTPCGLAARDSLRIEAGLPLYGHELAGPLGMNPADAGFAAYVRLYKPFFIGKRAFIAHERARDQQIVRFRLNNKRARPAHQGDPVVDERGKVVGTVTSCSIDAEGYQLGQALIQRDLRKAGTVLGVYSGAERLKPLVIRDLRPGAKATLPEPAVVLTRFPR
jgi:glycine hydroxymethyltransferase